MVVDDMLFCIVTFNLWLHYNKLLTYLLTYSGENHQNCCHQMSNFKAKMYQIQFCWGAYSALPDALAGLRGPTSKGRGGEGKERGKRGEGRKREGMGGVRKGRGGEGESKVKTPPPSITAYSPAPDWSNSYRLSVRSY